MNPWLHSNCHGTAQAPSFELITAFCAAPINNQVPCFSLLTGALREGHLLLMKRYKGLLPIAHRLVTP